MKSIKRIMATAMATALAIMPLVSCSSSGDSGSDSDGKVTLTYYSWSNEKVMRPVIDAFEQDNPDIKIDMSSGTGGANGYVQALTTRIAGNQIPDIFHISTATRHEILDNGYALDLTNEPFMEGIDQSAKDFYTKDGHVYGMAPTAWMGVIVFNKDILKAAGYDTVPATLEEFNKMGEKIKAQGKIPYMEDPSVISGSFCAMLPGYYAKQNDKDGDEDIWDGKATFKEKWGPALKDWTTMYKTGTLPSNVVGVAPDQIKQEFYSGNLAMFRSGLWDYKNLVKSGINFEAAAYPALKGGEQYIGGGPDSPYAINAKLTGKKLEAAKKFLAFINSAKGLEVIQKETSLMPTSSKYKADVPEQFRSVFENFAMKGKYGWVNWGGNGPAMSQDMVSQFQLLIQGKVDSDEVLDHLQQTWNNSSK